MNRLLLLPLAAAVLAAGTAHAQRPIIPGEFTRGTLNTSDPRMQDDAYYDEYVFEARRGEMVVVTMESDDFDTFLYLGAEGRNGFREVARDDDGGDGTDSRIRYQVPESGLYVIRATSLNEATGRYTITLTGGRATTGGVGGYEPEPIEPVMRPGREGRGGPVEANEVVSGRLSRNDPTLDNGTAYHLWTYRGRRGERLTLTLRSTEFDPYLVVGTAGGRHGIGSALARDDDGAGGRDSRIDFTLPNDGEYVIRVNPLVASTGRYTLEVRSDRYPAGYDDRPDNRPDDRPRPRPRPGRAQNGGPIEPGQALEGWLSETDPTLDNGTAYHLYTYRARRSERLTITLRSNDFDPYLVIGTPGGRHGVGSALARDDDGGGGRDSRIDFTVPSDGEYVIRVNPLAASTGQYVLELQSDRVGRDRPRRDDYDSGAVDADLVGRWGLVLPTVQVDPESWTSVAANAGMGYLRVGEDGSYTWEKNGRTRRGQLQPIRPRRGAQVGIRYYLITDGRDEYYVFFAEDRNGDQYMQVNSRATDAAVAYGYQDNR